MSRIGRNITTILRTERMIARHNMARLRTRAGLLAVAAVLALLGVVMLNLAAFHALSGSLRPQVAALIVGLSDVGLGLILALIAARAGTGPQIAQITELRDLAIAELEEELDTAIEDMRELSGSLRRIAHDPIGSALPAVIGPLLALLLKQTGQEPSAKEDP